MVMNKLIAQDPELGPVKWCPVCKEWWPADTEFIPKASAKKDGLHPHCKACSIERRWPNGRAQKVETRIYSSWEYLLGLVDTLKPGVKSLER